MKRLSTVIAELQAIQAKHGDIYFCSGPNEETVWGWNCTTWGFFQKDVEFDLERTSVDGEGIDGALVCYPTDR